ncbi:YqaA family protein [Candidatus Halobeggiatoa sp. HSG11]|nr:YqaA family protein [Candidatus Halobeggiatoa sp. HSG11]
MAILTLFISAFLSATILPFSSEIILTSLVLSGEYNLLILWVSATVGNVIGAIINWWLGRYVIIFQEKKWFPFKQKELNKAREIFLKYGLWTLLFAWLPIIGDPLTFIAGVFRVPIGIFTMLVLLGKGLRYAVVIYLLLQF